MTPSRILPDLQSALLCEDIRQEASGNLILIGVINYIRVPQLPIKALKLCLLTRWTSGFGQFLESVRLIAPDRATELRKSEMKFSLKDVIHNVTNVSVLSPIKLETAGTYYVEILVDDVLKLRFPIVVMVLPPDQAPEVGPTKEP